VITVPAGITIGGGGDAGVVSARRGGIGSVCHFAGRQLTPWFPDVFAQSLCLRKSITKGACSFGPRIALFFGMDYKKMKALMETNREGSAAQRKPEVKEFPRPDSEPDSTYLGYDLTKERIAA
jgi:hypothetical protein